MCFLPWKFSFDLFLDLDLWFRSSEISLSSMNSVLEFSGLHCCLFVKVQARQIVVQSFWKACFHKMYCAMRCCATALSEQCFSASCPCFCVASFCCSCLTQLWYNIMCVLHCQHFFKTFFNFFLLVDHPCSVDFYNSISLSSLSITKIWFFYFLFTRILHPLNLVLSL